MCWLRSFTLQLRLFFPASVTVHYTAHHTAHVSLSLLLLFLLSSRELRALVVEMVLATDMSCHFQQVKTMKNFLQQPEGSVASIVYIHPVIYIFINPAINCCLLATTQFPRPRRMRSQRNGANLCSVSNWLKQTREDFCCLGVVFLA